MELHNGDEIKVGDFIEFYYRFPENPDVYSHPKPYVGYVVNVLEPTWHENGNVELLGCIDIDFGKQFNFRILKPNFALCEIQIISLGSP